MMHTILVPLDGSSLAEQALPQACRMAKETGSTLLLLRAAPYSTGEAGTPSPLRVTVSIAREYLQSVQQRLVSDGVVTRIEALRSDPLRAILFTARRHCVDLIVMCTHGRTGLLKVLLGSVADQVVHEATVPVLLVRATDLAHTQAVSRPQKLLLPLDGSDYAEAALTFVTEQGLAKAAEVLLLRAVPPTVGAAMPGRLGYAAGLRLEEARMATERHRSEAEQYLSSVARRYLGGTAYSTYVQVEYPAKAILEVARAAQVDLIVMVRHGSTEQHPHSYSRVVRHVLHHAPAPMLLLHATSPITTLHLVKDLDTIQEAMPVGVGGPAVGPRPYVIDGDD